MDKEENKGEDIAKPDVITQSLNLKLTETEQNSYWRNLVLSERFKLGFLKYGVTILATAASSFTLEAISLSAGTFAAGINPLEQFSPAVGVGVLGLSYLLWFHGLSVNARESWKLLEETGISPSWWAKVGYDVSHQLTTNTRIHKAATYVGFSALEMAKELPWWVAAYGGKFAISELDPSYNTNNMEFAFLAGANVAAAGFNYAQAGGVEGVLRLVKNNRLKDMIHNLREKRS